MLLHYADNVIFLSDNAAKAYARERGKDLRLLKIKPRDNLPTPKAEAQSPEDAS